MAIQHSVIVYLFHSPLHEGDTCQPVVQSVGILGTLHLAVCAEHAANAVSWLADQVTVFVVLRCLCSLKVVDAGGLSLQAPECSYFVITEKRGSSRWQMLCHKTCHVSMLHRNWCLAPFGLRRMYLRASHHCFTESLYFMTAGQRHPHWLAACFEAIKLAC